MVSFWRHDVTWKLWCFSVLERGDYSKNSDILQLAKMGSFQGSWGVAYAFLFSRWIRFKRHLMQSYRGLPYTNKSSFPEGKNRFCPDLLKLCFCYYVHWETTMNHVTCILNAKRTSCGPSKERESYSLSLCKWQETYMEI